MRSLSTLSFVSFLLTACVAAPDLDDVDLAVTHGTLTDDAPWGVYMEFSNSQEGEACTGILLTSRWALTAGHCVEWGATTVTINATVPGGGTGVGRPDIVYAGSMRWREHADLDIALVYLSRPGAGVDLTRTGKAKIWNHPSNPPWQGGSVADRTFDLVGWGNTNQSASGACQPQINNPPLKFKGAFELDGHSSYDDARVHGDSSVRDACIGDSGAPWIITRGNIKMAFALHKGPIRVPFDIEQVGILLNRLRPWIASTSALMSSLSIVSCNTGFLSGGVSWTECSEGPPPPPPPGNGCAINWICCEDGEEPGTCHECRPSWGLCE